MNVKIKPSCFKEIDKLPPKDQDKITVALENLENLKSLSDASGLLKIKGKEHEFRLKVGSYRVLLVWNKKEQILRAIAVAHRQSVYNKK
jgi:mRNA-degrading endonuclease RelE of RelBE toxin-antitoxin system